MEIKAKIESILFMSKRAVSTKKIADLIGIDKKEVKNLISEMKEEYKQRNSGLTIVTQGERVEMATHPDNNELMRKYLKDERTGELTGPSLETLTIIAYRGPITKAELEMIRGINCSMIIRNLLIRGLINEKMDNKKGVPIYTVSINFVKYLGLSDISELPDYQKLNQDIKLGQILMDQKKNKEDFFTDVE
ncbi:MAG: SMC-Scp complex subunit ScpB [Patescibacteria group bacterium]